MKVEDRVRYIGPDENLQGKEGYLKKAYRGYAGVAFDEEVLDGHDLAGMCEDKHGLYIPISTVEKICKFAIGEEACVIAGNGYGLSGVIQSYFDTEEGTTVYDLETQNGKVSYDETFLVKESEFVPSPYSIGQHARFTKSGLEKLTKEPHNWSFGELLSFNLFNFTIKECQYLDNAFSFGSDNFRSLTIDMIEPVDELHGYVALTELYTNQYRRELNRGNLNSNLYFSVTNMYSMYFETLVLYANMCVAYSQEKLNSKNYEELERIKDYNKSFIFILPGEDNFNRVDLDDYYSGSDDCIIVTLKRNEDTFKSFVEMFERRSYTVQDVVTTENGTGYFSMSDNNTRVFVCDLFDMETSLHHIREYLESIFGSNEFTTLLEEEKFEEALEQYKLHCEAFIARKSALKRAYDISQSIKSLSESVLNRLRNQEVDIKDECDDLQSTLRDKYVRLREIQLQILGIKNGQMSDEQHSLQILLDSLGDRLVYVKMVNDDSIEFQVMQDWIYFDEQVYETSNVRKTYGEKYGQWLYDLLDEIVKTQKIGLTFEQTVLLCGNGAVVCRQYERSSIKRDINLGIPNPHHCYYNCWGNNTNPISKSFIEGRYTAAISQVLSAMGGINFADGTVFNKLLNILTELSKENCEYWNNNKCLYDKETGERFTVAEYRKKKEEEQKK